MSFFCRLSGKHYWCTPHRSADNDWFKCATSVGLNVQRVSSTTTLQLSASIIRSPQLEQKSRNSQRPV